MIKCFNTMRQLIPLIIYALLLLIILLSKKFLGYSYTISITASFMLIVPVLLGEDKELFSFNLKGFKKAVLWSLAILLVYTVFAILILKILGKQAGFSFIGYHMVFIHLFLIAIPEEVFFRGYLQKKFGNNIRAIIYVSLLFALAHFLTICMFGNLSMFTCAQNILTFFPSLVMGYLYYKSNTIWASVFFHFIANIIHLSVVLN